MYTEPLTQDRVLQAMRESLGIPDATIEVTELSTEPAPRGRIEFPRDRLGIPASADRRLPVLWRGRSNLCRRPSLFYLGQSMD